jgi:hypothetical protein
LKFPTGDDRRIDAFATGTDDVSDVINKSIPARVAHDSEWDLLNFEPSLCQRSFGRDGRKTEIERIGDNAGERTDLQSHNPDILQFVLLNTLANDIDDTLCERQFVHVSTPSSRLEGAIQAKSGNNGANSEFEQKHRFWRLNSRY